MANTAKNVFAWRRGTGSSARTGCPETVASSFDVVDVGGEGAWMAMLGSVGGDLGSSIVRPRERQRMMGKARRESRNSARWAGCLGIPSFAACRSRWAGRGVMERHRRPSWLA